MAIKYSRLRTFLFTFTLGLTIVSFYTRLSEYLKEIPVNMPKVESETPIIIRICPEISINGKGIFYQENGYIYFSKEKAINCVTEGGGGYSGRED